MRPWCRRTASLAIAVIAPAMAAPAVERPSAVARPDVPPVALDAAVALAESLPRLHSLIVSWRDELVLEAYFNGARASRTANIKSASKSIISALVGVAIDRGWIEGVDQPMTRASATSPSKTC